MTGPTSHHTIDRVAVDGIGHLLAFSTAHPDGLVANVGCPRDPELHEVSCPASSDVARRLTDWLRRNIAATGHGGALTSTSTVKTYVKHLGWVHDHLLSRGITSFSGPALTYAVGREVAALRPEASYRSPAVRAFIDCARLAGNPDQLLLHSEAALLHGPTPTTSEMAYPPEVCAGLEAWARQEFADHVARAKAALAALGLDTSDDSLFRLTADAVIGAGHAAGGDLGKLVVALANDAPIGFWPARKMGMTDDERRLVNNGLSVPGRVLAAAHVLLTLDKDAGHNDQPVKSLRPSDTTVRDNGITVTVMTKTRHGAAYKVVGNHRRMFSYSGVLTRMAWLTALDRHRRRQRATSDLAGDRADLLFQTIAGNQAAYLAFPAPGTRPEPLGEDVNISTRRLRKSVLQRRILKGDDLALAAASPGQVEVYFTSALPKAEVERITTANLDAMVATSTAFLDGTSIVQPGVQDTAEDTELDRGVATCGSGGTDPETDELCRRGLLGCFACPSARITERNAPGLAAAVRATDHIRQHGPQEWVLGPAPAIWSFSTAALKRLRTTPDEQMVQAAMPVVLATYYEAR